MADRQFSMADLMDLLVQKAGLGRDGTTDDPGATFDDVGLDSLAFLQLQTELQNMHGVELPDNPHEITFGEIVDYVNDHLAKESAA